MQRILVSPIEPAIRELVATAQKRVTVISPWIKAEPFGMLLAVALPSRIQWRVLLRGRLEDFLAGTSDLRIVEELLSVGAFVGLINDLHAKVIAVDGTTGIIGSANLTLAGGRHNLELAVLVEGHLVTEAEAQVESWLAGCRRVDADWLEQMRFRVDAALARSVDVKPFSAEDLEGPNLGPGDAPPSAEPKPSGSGAQDASSQVSLEESFTSTVELPGSEDSREELYRDLPLPQQWINPLRELIPRRADPLPTFSVDEVLQAAVKNALDCLSEGQRTVLRGLYQEEMTLQEVGNTRGVTRQRIQQIEARGLSIIREKAPGVLVSLRRSLFGESLLLVSVVRTTGQDAATLHMAAGLFGALNGGEKFRVKPLGGGLFLVYDEGEYERLGVLARDIFTEPDFITAQMFVQHMQLELDALPALMVLLRESVIWTEVDLVGWRKWPKRNKLMAVARHLSIHGFVEWHFSELAKAAAVVDPEDFEHYTGRAALAVLMHYTADFEFAGRAGYWRLREFGDGFRTTQEAIQAVVNAANYPLHHEEVRRRLNREVSRGTIYQTLQNEAAFRAYGDGVFGLVNRRYEVAAKLREWILALLTPEEPLPWAELELRARQSQLDPVEVRGAISLMPEVRFHKAVPRRPAWIQRMT